MVVNHERNLREPDATSWKAGLEVFDLSDPTSPQSIGFHPVKGKGVHRVTYWEHPYAYISASDDGYTDQFFVAVDLTDPENPVEAGRWALPGMHAAAGEVPTWGESHRAAHHHSIIRGDRAYAGWVDSGLVILDISDISSPQFVSQLDFGTRSTRPLPDSHFRSSASLLHGAGSMTHSAVPIPGKELLVVTEEAVRDNCMEVKKSVWVVDISDEKKPVVIGQFPVPEGDFCDRGGRFGPHNVHEMRPGTFQSDSLIFLTYFNGGIRVVDISDPASPTEVGHYVPEAPSGRATIQFNDVIVREDGTIFVTDRFAGGLYILEYAGA